MCLLPECIIINDKNNLTNEECPISKYNLIDYLKDSKNKVIKLNCGHCFSYKYFMTAYAINYKKYYGNRCPYCRNKIHNIPIIINKLKNNLQK